MRAMRITRRNIPAEVEIAHTKALRTSYDRIRALSGSNSGVAPATATVTG